MAATRAAPPPSHSMSCPAASPRASCTRALSAATGPRPGAWAKEVQACCIPAACNPWEARLNERTAVQWEWLPPLLRLIWPSAGTIPTTPLLLGMADAALLPWDGTSGQRLCWSHAPQPPLPLPLTTLPCSDRKKPPASSRYALSAASEVSDLLEAIVQQVRGHGADPAHWLRGVGAASCQAVAAGCNFLPQARITLTHHLRPASTLTHASHLSCMHAPRKPRRPSSTTTHPRCRRTPWAMAWGWELGRGWKL